MSVVIVSAFFEIGRGEWDSGFNRSTDTYLSYFANLAKVENKMIIFTNLEEKNILKYRQARETYIHKLNPLEEFADLYSEIKLVHQSPAYKSRLNPMTQNSPEYWNSKYVLVNILKPFLVFKALSQMTIKEDLIAWVDFGYLRSELPQGKSLELTFPKEKITAFRFPRVLPDDLIQIIFNNIVIIMGSPLVGGRDAWCELLRLTKRQVSKLLSLGLIDDDQTIWLMAYLENPDLFNLIERNEWFTLFRES